MIHEKICTFEVAKLAKEKGFPQEVSRWCDFTSPSRNYYNHKGELNGDCLEIIKCICRKEEVPIELQTIDAPTQSLLQRWLREEKGIVIDVVLDWEYNISIDIEKIRYQYRIGSIDEMTIEGGIKTKGIVFDKRFTTYEHALEDALKYALENLV